MIEKRELERIVAGVPRVHFVGVGGSGMAGLARIFLHRGKAVSGSDLAGSKEAANLFVEGVAVTLGHRGSAIDFDRGLVVASAAIHPRNAEIVAAEQKGIPVAKYAEVLAAVAAPRRVLAVGGCHGKTSTAAMLAFALREIGADPSWAIGGHSPQLGGRAREGRGEAFVVEACEYDRSFHHFEPEVAVVTNVDRDHLDTYGDFAGVVEGFRGFASRIRSGGALVVGGDSEAHFRGVEGDFARIPVVVGKGRDARAKIENEKAGLYGFRLRIQGRWTGLLRLSIPGPFQVANAACATFAAAHLGHDPREVAEAITRFEGVDRRFTSRGDVGGVTIVDDYAHHPAEIAATIETARAVYRGRRVLAVFQPHQYRRTLDMLDEFAEALSLADQVVLDRIWAARDREEDRRRVSAAALAARIRERGKRVDFRPDHYGLVALLEALAQPGDVLLFLGAGNIDEVAREFVVRMVARPAAARIAAAAHDAARRGPRAMVFGASGS